MSALGHKRTYAVQKGMSALPPKADMCGATRDVRFGPKADIRSLLDHFIGAQKERFGNRQAERLRRREIDDKLEFGRLLDWYVARLYSMQNLVHVICRVPEQI